MSNLLGEDVHMTRVLSPANGVVGLLHAAALGIHAIGRGLADALDLDPKHAVKQIDRLLAASPVVAPAVMPAASRTAPTPRSAAHAPAVPETMSALDEILRAAGLDAVDDDVIAMAERSIGPAVSMRGRTDVPLDPAERAAPAAAGNPRDAGAAVLDEIDALAARDASDLIASCLETDHRKHEREQREHRGRVEHRTGGGR